MFLNNNSYIGLDASLVKLLDIMALYSSCIYLKLNDTIVKEVLIMFYDKDNLMLHHYGFGLFTLASIAIAVPFIFYAKDISRSLRIIAENKKTPENI